MDRGLEKIQVAVEELGVDAISTPKLGNPSGRQESAEKQELPSPVMVWLGWGRMARSPSASAMMRTRSGPESSSWWMTMSLWPSRPWSGVGEAGVGRMSQWVSAE